MGADKYADNFILGGYMRQHGLEISIWLIPQPTVFVTHGSMERMYVCYFVFCNYVYINSH